MRIVFSGGRDTEKAYSLVLMAWNASPWSGEAAVTIVHGASGTVDLAAKRFAKTFEFECIEFEVTKEQWKKEGKPAGPRRNRKMAEFGDVLIAIWGGSSAGTLNMITEMIKAGKPVFIYPVKTK